MGDYTEGDKYAVYAKKLDVAEDKTPEIGWFDSSGEDMGAIADDNEVMTNEFKTDDLATRLSEITKWKDKIDGPTSALTQNFIQSLVDNEVPADSCKKIIFWPQTSPVSTLQLIDLSKYNSGDILIIHYADTSHQYGSYDPLQGDLLMSLSCKIIDISSQDYEEKFKFWDIS